MVYPGVIISGFVRVLLININTSTVFYQSLIGSRRVYFNLWRGILAAGSLASSLASSLVGSLASFLASSLVSSLAGLGYRYSFTAMVLKSVGLLGSYTLYIFLSILSSLNGPVYLPLYPVLPSRHISTLELRGRSQIVVTDRPFHQFSILLTCFLTLILAISSITFFIAAAYYIVDSTSRSSSLI